jgi:hypothetical protein
VGVCKGHISWCLQGSHILCGGGGGANMAQSKEWGQAAQELS